MESAKHESQSCDEVMKGLDDVKKGFDASCCNV